MPKETWRRTVERERCELGSKFSKKPVALRKTEKLGERERKALFSSEGKEQDDDDYDDLDNLG